MARDIDPNDTFHAPSPVAAGPHGMLRDAAGVAATMAVCVAVGFATSAVGMPLPWMLGPLFATAFLSLSGIGAHAMPYGRAGGQVLAGLAIGVQVTAAALTKLVLLLPVIVGATVVSAVVAMIGSYVLMRLARLDKATAYFATVPAGVAEMVNIGPTYGAQQEPITVAQTMRVGVVVSLTPFLVLQFGGDEVGFRELFHGAPMAWPVLAGLLALGILSGFALAWRKIPNGWLLAPMIVTAAIAALGLVEGRVPDLVLVLAQILIGSSLGAQFRREYLLRLPGLMASSGVAVLLTMGLMVSMAGLLAFALDLAVPTLVLALAPAGIAEMVLTGKILGLDAALITGFQFVRVVLVVLAVRHVYALWTRIM